MLHGRFIYRQIISSKKQAAVFVLSVALSLVTLVSLGGFSSSVRESTLKDARQLHAADIIVRSHYPFSPALSGAVKKYVDDGRGQSALVHEFYSMALDPAGGQSILSQLKVVEKGYPFYGSVELASGRAFDDVLKKGAVIVEQGLLDRLQIKTGAPLKIGSAALTVADVVTGEPDRPVSFFSFGPRIFVSADDLDALALLGKGSRIHFTYLLKLHNADSVDTAAAELSASALEGQEHVETFQTAQSGVKRFFENFIFFLSLIGVFTLLLAGIGIQTSLYALLRESEMTIAIMKTFGAAGNFIILHFLVMVMILGTAGTVAGLSCSFVIQLFFPALFSGILPADVTLSISWPAVIEGLVLGMFVVGLFTFLPLWNIKNVKPAFIFRKESVHTRRGRQQYMIIIVIVAFFSALVVWQLEDVKTGIYFVLALTGLILVTAFMSGLFLRSLNTFIPSSLALRQAIKGLHRPKNATKPIIITLSASLAFIFSLYLVEQNLQATYVNSYPPDIPNAYFLDIQTDQKKDFAAIAGSAADYHPIVRARIASINGRPVVRTRELRKRRDNLAREFNLTYRSTLLDDERLVKGKGLFGYGKQELARSGEVPVSVLDTFADENDIRMGDLIVFKIQGIPLNARVTSIRTRTASKARPFFYFVFPEEVLEDAPHTIFAAARLDSAELAVLQNNIVRLYPNISVIDVSQSLEVLARIMHKLSSVIQFFSSFSMIAGLLIIISSIFATQYARIQEAVYFKVLGATSSFVLQVFSCENLLTGFICSVLAGAISQAGSWIICTRVFEIPYHAFPAGTVLMMSATVAMVIVVGMVSSVPVLHHKPVVFLRQQAQE